MSNDSKSTQVVYTNKAHCRDCYRCLRVCPVKAIRMEGGQAYVVPERCISCGTCIRECPQGAKQYRNDVERAVGFIAAGDTVAASIAPSFVALFSESERKRLPSALRKLGFNYVGETAIGAYFTARETARICNADPERSHICTACPAVVSYIEIYDREKIDLMLPLTSPMVAHAKNIKAKLGTDSRVVFFGPCVAKKAEADRPENQPWVDCALTFPELMEWLERENIHLAMCEESQFSEQPEGDSRFFPLVGGSIRTASLNTDLLAADMVSASGYEEVKEALSNCGPDSPPQVVEPLFCAQGCINGPAMHADDSLYRRRRDVIDYANSHPGAVADPEADYGYVHTEFTNRQISQRDVTEEQIREVMEKQGKTSPENQLNCGACGYASCRDKAIAVIRGMAELEMCIPYMKRLAEQRTDRIIETSPNGILILDKHLKMIHMNPTFRKFFMCSEAVIGHNISYLMDPDPFEQLATGKTDMVTSVVNHEKYNLVCHEILYALPEEQQFVGIFVDITHNRANKEKLDKLREQTITQTKELLQHQILMAQTIAKFLGQSTGQSEALLSKLMQMAGDEPGEGRDVNEWLRDTYTSK